MQLLVFGDLTVFEAGYLILLTGQPRRPGHVAYCKGNKSQSEIPFNFSVRLDFTNINSFTLAICRFISR